MRELADGVWQLDGWPPNTINVYLVGDVLVDAGVRQNTGRILRELLGAPIRLFVAAQVESAHPVARTLREGDQVSDFQVLDTPGHTPGHIAFWRERDRALIMGDVIWNFQFFAGRPGMTQPPPTSSTDPARNRESARRLAALRPELVCFGHGPPLRDPAKFATFVDGLAA